MPGFDGTGPTGIGPMTGGGFGRCASPVGYGFAAVRGVRRSIACGRYFGRGLGLRQRLCWNFVPNEPTEVDWSENEMLKNEAQFLKSRISILENLLLDVEKRLKKYEKSADDKENS